MNKVHRTLALCLSALIVFRGLVFVLWQDGSQSCPLSGEGSSAPINLREFRHDVDKAVQHMRSKSRASAVNVMCTTMNNAAATHNFPPFYKSIQALGQPSLIDSLVIFCMDPSACKTCSLMHVDELCVFMDLGISGTSLAPPNPGGNASTAGNKEGDYWKLTFGRVFATMSLHAYNLNVLALDIDSIFFRSPFDPDSGIIDRPNDIAVVQDIRPFTFQYGDKAPINGGFLYFPGADPTAAGYSKELLDRIWMKNCLPKSNEQLVTSSALRFLTRKYKHNKEFHPHVLSSEKYLNFCSAKCGKVYDEFASIQSLDELRNYDRKMSGNPTYRECERAVRQNKWVFFHVACTVWPSAQAAQVSEWKQAIQVSLYQWVRNG